MATPAKIFPAQFSKALPHFREETRVPFPPRKAEACVTRCNKRSWLRICHSTRSMGGRGLCAERRELARAPRIGARSAHQRPGVDVLARHIGRKCKAGVTFVTQPGAWAADAARLSIASRHTPNQQRGGSERVGANGCALGALARRTAAGAFVFVRGSSRALTSLVVANEVQQPFSPTTFSEARATRLPKIFFENFRRALLRAGRGEG